MLSRLECESLEYIEGLNRRAELTEDPDNCRRGKAQEPIHTMAWSTASGRSSSMKGMIIVPTSCTDADG
jgi:hypothetical protein